MRKKHISKLFYGAALATLLSTSPAFAFGWPTFDIAEVFNTIQSVISQAQAQIATVQETISVANIQQAIGDKLGALSKIKDVKAKAEKLKEKAEKVQKRIEKVKQLKEKYEKAARDAINQVQEKYQEGVNMVNDVKNQVENAKNQVENTINDAKNQVENVKNQVENTINDAKNQVENAKSQVENAINDAKNQVENAKNQVENAYNNAKDQVENAKNQAQDLYGGLQNGFGGTTNAADGSFDPFQSGYSEGANATGGAIVPYGSNSTGSTYSIEDGEDIWEDGAFGADETSAPALSNSGNAPAQGGFVGNTEPLQDDGKGDISWEDENNSTSRKAFKAPAQGGDDNGGLGDGVRSADEIEHSSGGQNENTGGSRYAGDDNGGLGDGVRSADEIEHSSGGQNENTGGSRYAGDDNGGLGDIFGKRGDDSVYSNSGSGGMKDGNANSGSSDLGDIFGKRGDDSVYSNSGSGGMKDGNNKNTNSNSGSGGMKDGNANSGSSDLGDIFGKRGDDSVYSNSGSGGMKDGNANSGSGGLNGDYKKGEKIGDEESAGGVKFPGGDSGSSGSGKGEPGDDVTLPGASNFNGSQGNNLSRKAFGRISYVNDYQSTFASMSASFKTGTDEAGNYYYPDTFANWVGFNYDEKLDEDKMEAAVKTICDDLNSSSEEDVATYKNRYLDMIKEARAYAEAYAATAVGATESEKTTDDLSQMIDTASDSTRTQLAGIGEMGVNEIAQNKKQMIMIANTLQAEIFDELLQYCRITYERGEGDED